MTFELFQNIFLQSITIIFKCRLEKITTIFKMRFSFAADFLGHYFDRHVVEDVRRSLGMHFQLKHKIRDVRLVH